MYATLIEKRNRRIRMIENLRLKNEGFEPEAHQPSAEMNAGLMIEE